jgi:hypothetical protein
VGHWFAAASLDASKLRDAIIDVVSNPEVFARAATIGDLIAMENGVTNAKRTLYSIVRSSVVWCQRAGRQNGNSHHNIRCFIHSEVQ